MTDQEMKRLKRADLLELLIGQIKENDQLRARLKEAEAQLESRRITISKAGTLAQACLELNGVFESAEAAASQYLENLEAFHNEKAGILSPQKASNAAEPEVPETAETIPTGQTPAGAACQPTEKTVRQCLADADEQARRRIREADAQAQCRLAEAEEQAHRQLEDTVLHCQQLEEETRRKCGEMLEQAQTEAQARWEKVDRRTRDLAEVRDELRALFTGKAEKVDDL